MVNYPNWIIHRNAWLKEHFNIDPKKIIHTSAKYLIAADVFVDDQPNNIQKWIDRRNGVAVLFAHKYNLAYANQNRAIYTNNWDVLEAITLGLRKL